MGRKLILEFFSILKLVVIIGVIVIVGRTLTENISFEATDITTLLTADKSTVEQSLAVTLTNNPVMASEIHQYGGGLVTVESDADSNIGIIYIDSLRKGVYVTDKKYSLYGLEVGTAMVSVDNDITYPYTDNYEVYNDNKETNTSVYLYYNSSKNDCLIIVANEVTNRVRSITYFNDYNQVTKNVNQYI